MPAPPQAQPRSCCSSYNGYAHQPGCTRRGGRPTTGETPVRAAGRHGKIWDDCVAQAKADGQDMTTFVRDAITRELARRRMPRARRAHDAAQLGTIAVDGEAGQ